MGGLVSKKIFSLFYKNKEVRIFMTGLDAAGKTTVLYTLKLGEVVTTIPTIGFNVETLHFKGVNFTTWDVGGRDKIRPLWRHYYQNTDIMIFVVDSNDRERINDAADELQRFLSEDELKDCILLVLANKQDLPNAMSVEEVTDKMKLNSLRNRNWFIQGTSAINKDGLYEGLEWLQTQVTNKDMKKVVTAPVKESFVPLGEKLSMAFSSVKNYFWSTS